MTVINLRSSVCDCSFFHSRKKFRRCRVNSCEQGIFLLFLFTERRLNKHKFSWTETPCSTLRYTHSHLEVDQYDHGLIHWHWMPCSREGQELFFTLPTQIYIAVMGLYSQPSRCTCFLLAAFILIRGLRRKRETIGFYAQYFTVCFSDYFSFLQF